MDVQGHAETSYRTMDLLSTADGASRYLRSLFPFTRWIGRYNTTWLVGDVIGGLTLGFVVVPQAMAYALLAHLSPQHGLYTSLAGASLYWLFGTAKDVAIGATAVVSLLVGRVVSRVEAEHPGVFSAEEVAKTLAMLAGACLLGFGMLRLDWIVELVPHVAIAAFVTGAAVTISLSQVPTMLGIPGVDTRASAVRVFASIVGRLDECTLDAAVGIATLIFLQLVKSYCARMASQTKRLHQQRAWDTLGSVRMSLAVLISTLLSFLLHQPLPPTFDPYFRILGAIPTGLTALGPPTLHPTLIRTLLPSLPAVLVVLVVEHIAIGKAFARQNNYAISASQECVASGAANLVGPLIGAYAATGSFTGTAVLSKAGVRTPLAGVFNAAVLLAAAYACSGVFYYIPMASLAALIVHAVGNLVVRWETLEKWWRVQRVDVLVFGVGVAWSLGVALEEGIYATVGLSLVNLLMGVARRKGSFGEAATAKPRFSGEEGIPALEEVSRETCRGQIPTSAPGVVRYHFPSLNYLNQAQHMESISSHVRAQTRQTDIPPWTRPGDLPWNEHSSAAGDGRRKSLPLLRAIVLDLSSVEKLDVSSWDGLVDLRAQLDRWSSPDIVEWHFVGASAAVWNGLEVGGFDLTGGKKPPSTQYSECMPAATAGLGKMIERSADVVHDPAPAGYQQFKDRPLLKEQLWGSLGSTLIDGEAGPARQSKWAASGSLGAASDRSDDLPCVAASSPPKNYGTML